VRFSILPMQARLPEVNDAVFLEENKWNDYGYKTTFNLHYRDTNGAAVNIGSVKIGESGLDRGTPSLPSGFEELDERFFSLGQDDTYYERLNEQGERVRDVLLRSLNDVALNLDLFRRVISEPVTRKSLLRDVAASTVRNQFHRMTQGGARLSPFRFTYVYPTNPWPNQEALRLPFAVAPESQPPTNVHVVIGRNGVGKSHLLNNITSFLIEPNPSDSHGRVEFGSDGLSGSLDLPASSQFANVISVAFSAFDDFEPLSSSLNKSREMKYSYIGLKRRIPRSGAEESNTLKDSRALAAEFGMSVKACIQEPRLTRWRRALEMLESDPIFADVEVADLANDATDDDLLRSNARELFRELSSGHKIVLLTMTRLVESTDERSLILLDEPESHLHPPLLSAFIRALSDLLINRNGVAIVATHSPVVLQEVPSDCVWKLRRSGSDVAAERPQLETFGENVGTLTQEVFGLEVTNSGFHRMLTEAVRTNDNYDAVLRAFDGKIGAEGRALVQALLATSNQQGWR
jgi:predicted ATPase